MPQFFWIVHLFNFVNANTMLNIRHIDTLSQITPNHHNVDFNKDSAKAREELYARFQKNNVLQYYLLADSLLYSTLMNTTVSINDIADTFKTSYPDLFTDLFRGNDVLS